MVKSRAKHGDNTQHLKWIWWPGIQRSKLEIYPFVHDPNMLPLKVIGQQRKVWLPYHEARETSWRNGWIHVPVAWPMCSVEWSKQTTNPPFPLQLFHGAQNAKAKVPSVPYGGSLFHSNAAPASALAAIAQREAPLTGWMWETLPFLSTTIRGWFIPPTKKGDLENLGTTKQSWEDGSKPPLLFTSSYSCWDWWMFITEKLYLWISLYIYICIYILPGV